LRIDTLGNQATIGGFAQRLRFLDQSLGLFAHIDDLAGGVEHEPAKIQPHDGIRRNAGLQSLSFQFGMRAGRNREMIRKRAE